MNNHRHYALLLGALLMSTAAHCQVEPELPVVPYEIKSFHQSGKGSHRARLHVDSKAPAVRVMIPWRRRDADPQTKAIHVYPADHKAKLANVQPIEVKADQGVIAFEPTAGVGDYYVYYLPYSPARGVFEKAADYHKPEPTAEDDWLAANGLDEAGIKAGAWEKLPEAKVLAFQARDEFNSFNPMEVVATAGEVEKLQAAHPDATYMVFCEDRTEPVKMKRHLPLRWIQSGPNDSIELDARPNEYRPYQIALWANRQPIENVKLQFSDLAGPDGRTIPASAIDCINLAGYDDLGRPMNPEVSVPLGRVQPLWVGISIPRDAAGEYTGTVEVRPANLSPQTVTVKLTVAGEVLEDRGDSDPYRLTRLRWLNSRIGLDDTVLPPYTPVEVKGDEVHILNRVIRFGQAGLPSAITSNGRDVLAGPIQLRMTQGREVLSATGPAGEVTQTRNSRCTRQASGSLGPCTLETKTTVDFDGRVMVEATITPQEDLTIDDFSLVVPYVAASDDYMMGMGFRGGYRPEQWGWAWDPERQHNEVWIGSPESGMQVQLTPPLRYWEANWRDGREKHNPWFNGGGGGAVLAEQDGAFVLRTFTGPRTLPKGQPVTYRFRLLVTPFRPFRPDWENWLGENVAGKHHGTWENPWINYPFLTIDKLAGFIKEQRDAGNWVEIYYTSHQLASRAPELWALRSLGGEIVRDDFAELYYGDESWTSKAGGGHVWLREHLVEDYVPGWRQPLPFEEIDHSIALRPNSRWSNYWLEGIAFLMREIGLEGVYLDGVGHEGIVARRAWRVMKQRNPKATVRLHAGNGYDWSANRVSSMNREMDLLPYIDKLWCGEGFDYNRSPDYYMTEMTGIPFGTSSTMLEYNSGGNPWMGMLYAFQPAPWHGCSKSLREFVLKHDLPAAEMLGYWSDRCPVSTGEKNIPATAYVLKDRALIALASWKGGENKVRLNIDAEKLPFAPTGYVLRAEAIKKSQPARTFQLDEPIPVDYRKGWLLMLVPADAPGETHHTRKEKHIE